jgi:hypothetical protein
MRPVPGAQARSQIGQAQHTYPLASATHSGSKPSIPITAVRTVRADDLRRVSSCRCRWHPDDRSDSRRLVYELLDAHADSERLVRACRKDQEWRAYFGWLRDLQRIGRGILAEYLDA